MRRLVSRAIGWILIGGAAAALGMACLASPAAAKVVTDKVTGQRFGIVPTPVVVTGANRPLRTQTPSGSSSTPTCDATHVDSTCATPLARGSGPVQHGEKEYLLFWDPNSFSGHSGYVSGMKTWLSDLAAGDYSTGHAGGRTGNPLSVVQQYYDLSGPGGTKSFVPYHVQSGGALMDTDPYPTSGCTDQYTDYYDGVMPHGTKTFPSCLTALQIAQEVANYLSAHPSLPTGLNVEYFVLTPSTVGSCLDHTTASCAVAQYCGWHSGFTVGSKLVLFADMPWSQGTTCEFTRSGITSNLYSNGIDAEVGIFSHELAETMTDPETNGWQGTGGSSDEIGDKCAVQFSVGYGAFDLTGLPTATGVPSGTAAYNAVLSGHKYLLQMEYNNRAAGCTQWDTDTQPSATLSVPSRLTRGVAGSFSLAHVVAPAGIAYVNWNFGDGHTGFTAGTTAIHHTYHAAGSYTVTAIITDKHGNELKKSAGPVAVP